LKHARGLPSIVAIAVLACLAIFFGIFILFTTDQQVAGVAAAVVCLALAQIVMMATSSARSAQLEKDMLFLSRGQQISDQKYHESFVATDLFDTEIAELKRRAQRFETDMQDARSTARSQYQELNQRYETAAANTPVYPPPPRASQAPQKEQLNFLLQPIIDLSTNVTAHYRAQFSITAATGAEIDYEKLILNADRGGLRPSLDVHVTGQAIPLLRRLRVKNPGMKMFIPIGAATLMSERSLAVMTAALTEARDVANGIVFELTHEALGRLNETGIAGLASIARIGATMALTDASVGGLDLTSLRKLGVKFIGINAGTIESGFGIASTWHEFVQIARGLQFQVMLTDVANSKQAAASAQIARLVAGPFFAPPRRVKLNVGLGSGLDLSNAA
jgi:EAL domain-containing protein (putative c-di-GMP-specific phosphodiesterase class I)